MATLKKIIRSNLLQTVPQFAHTFMALLVAAVFVGRPAELPQKRLAFKLAAVKSSHIVPLAAPGITTQSYPFVPFPSNFKFMYLNILDIDF